MRDPYKPIQSHLRDALYDIIDLLVEIRDCVKPSDNGNKEDVVVITKEGSVKKKINRKTPKKGENHGRKRSSHSND